MIENINSNVVKLPNIELKSISNLDINFNESSPMNSRRSSTPNLEQLLKMDNKEADYLIEQYLKYRSKKVQKKGRMNKFKHSPQKLKKIRDLNELWEVKKNKLGKITRKKCKRHSVIITSKTPMKFGKKKRFKHRKSVLDVPKDRSRSSSFDLGY